MTQKPLPRPDTRLTPGNYWLSPDLKFYRAMWGHTRFLIHHVVPEGWAALQRYKGDEANYIYALTRDWHMVIVVSEAIHQCKPCLVVDNGTSYLSKAVLEACIAMAQASDLPQIVNDFTSTVVWGSPQI